MAFSYRDYKRRRQRIVFIILTVFLSLGLLGTSVGWFLDASAIHPPAGVETFSPEQIIADLESQAKDHPKDAGIAARLARAYQDAGRTGQAVKAYEKALQLDPNNSELRIQLALNQFLTGQYDQAAVNLKEEIKRNPGNVQAYYYYAQVLALGKGDYQGGIRELQKFIDLARTGEDVTKARQMIEQWQSQLKQ